MKRREFLSKSLVGLGAVTFAPSFGCTAEEQVQPKPAFFDPQQQDIPLGKTGIKMSRMCMGTGMRGGNRQSNHTRMGKEKFEALIRYAYEHGVRTFDLADLYGTHPYVIPALKEVPRKKIQIISKIWFRSGGIPESERPDADIVIQRFCKEVGTDYLDLVLLHCVTDKDWNTKLSKQMEIMDNLKKKGVIRAHGVSCHSLESLQTAADEPWVDSVHARINAFGDKMDGSPEIVMPVLQKMHAAGKGVVGMKLIGEGNFRNEPEKKDKSVQFVLQSGAVDVLNVGFERPEEIDDFAGRVAKTPVFARV
ncbi:MAG: aldo/keto reductase [Phycisphaerae bacterium]|nr:aldo/keto reductase [Phycisphaerae bacterium]